MKNDEATKQFVQRERGLINTWNTAPTTKGVLFNEILRREWFTDEEDAYRFLDMVETWIDEKIFNHRVDAHHD